MQRDQVLDICKGIGILAVIVGHVPLHFVSTNVIYFFHMPLFFYCSGITHSKNTPSRNISTGFMMLYNYILYGLVFCLAISLVSGQSVSSNLYNLFIATPASIWAIPGFGVYWFIIALAGIKLICSSSFIHKNWIIGFGLFLTASFISKYIPFNNLPFCIGPIIISLIFFQAGQFHNTFLKIIRKHVTKALIFTIAVYFGLSIYSIWHYDGLSQKLVNYHHTAVFNPFLALILGFAGIVIIIAVSYFSTFNATIARILGFYGKYSFILFISHLLIIQTISAFIPDDVWSNYLLYSKIAVILLTLIACTLLAQLVSILPKRRTMLTKLLFMQ